jgi:hypothetical protein
MSLVQVSHDLIGKSRAAKMGLTFWANHSFLRSLAALGWTVDQSQLSISNLAWSQFSELFIIDYFTQIQNRCKVDRPYLGP